MIDPFNVNPFIVFSTIIFIYLGVIWSKDGYINLLYKLIFIGMGLWGLFMVLRVFGYIIKA